MQVVRTVAAMRAARAEAAGTVGFVPTMGALHEGHLSLVERARASAEVVVASVFVNPTQFNDPADFEKYPRTEAADLRQLEAAGVDVAFIPTASEMYFDEEQAVMVDVPGLTGVLEGFHRPGHFAGVCRVVAKLFNIVRPDVSVFGEKDFQQLRVIEAMVVGLAWPMRIVRGATLREPDGLAMSSRNRRLSAEDRERALAISRSLFAAREDRRGLRELEAEVARRIANAGLEVDYVAAVDEATLRPATDRPARLLVAARVGEVRLIDNVALP